MSVPFQFGTRIEPSKTKNTLSVITLSGPKGRLGANVLKSTDLLNETL